MTRTSEGIQSLLAAEKKAVEKIEQSKRNKIRRLKEAKEEADKEIEQLQRSHEGEFRSKEVMDSDAKGTMQTKMNDETQTRLKEMEAEVTEHRDRIVKRILEKVYEITPKMHVNARFDEEDE